MKMQDSGEDHEDDEGQKNENEMDRRGSRRHAGNIRMQYAAGRRQPGKGFRREYRTFRRGDSRRGTAGGACDGRRAHPYRDPDVPRTRRRTGDGQRFPGGTALSDGAPGRGL